MDGARGCDADQRERSGKKDKKCKQDAVPGGWGTWESCDGILPQERGRRRGPPRHRSVLVVTLGQRGRSCPSLNGGRPAAAALDGGLTNCATWSRSRSRSKGLCR